LDLWESPPFEPSLRNGKLYGRGVSDNKGNITSRLLALDALLAVEGELPCNVKFVIEGEEETSSVHLNGFVKNNLERLAADACIWEFGSVDEHEVRSRPGSGICSVGPEDGYPLARGSIFPNAAWRLVWALSSLKGPDEHIRIPGHYDNVIPPSQQDRQFMEALPDQAEEYKSRYGVKYFLHGLKGGVDLRLTEVFQPTCTICGLTSGYQGPGSKTVLPARASAKVDFRLVPDQTPEQVPSGCVPTWTCRASELKLLTLAARRLPHRSELILLSSLVVELRSRFMGYPCRLSP
jgi:acetylornithine deacetylase/succinyl-diaminopimelate desuccinylase-like protein